MPISKTALVTPQFINFGVLGTPDGLVYCGKGETCNEMLKENATDTAMDSLRHRDIVSAVQTPRSDSVKSTHLMSRKEQSFTVVNEVKVDQAK